MELHIGELDVIDDQTKAGLHQLAGVLFRQFLFLLAGKIQEILHDFSDAFRLIEDIFHVGFLFFVP